MLAIALWAICAGGAAEEALEALSRKDPSGFRPPPLRSLGVTRKVLMKDHGLLPDTGRDCLLPFQGIRACLGDGEGPVEVILEPGVYLVQPPPESVSVLDIVGKEDFILNGNGATVIIGNPQCGFIHLRSCRRAIIEGFSVDYDPLPFTQGRIIAVNRAESYVDVRLDDGFPLADGWYFTAAKDRFAGIRLRDSPIATKPLQRHTFPVARVDRLGTRDYRYRTFAPALVGNAEVGDPFWDVARLNGRQIVSALLCEDVSMIAVTAFSSPSVVFLGMLSQRINVLDCAVRLKPGRDISVNADCVHFPLNAVGPWVENCTFEGCVDDVMNIYGLAFQVVRVDDQRTLTVSGPAGSQAFMDQMKGTTFSIVDPESGTTTLSARILEARRVSPADTTVRLDRPFDPGRIKVLPGQDAMRTDPELRWRADSAYFEGMMGAGFVVRGNAIVHGHRFGIIAPSRDGLIEDNAITGTGGAAIVVLNRMNEHPARMTYHARGGIVIRGNTITDCNLGSTYAEQNVPGAIDIGFHNRFFQDTPAQELQDLVVLGNVVEDVRVCGIAVSSAAGVLIADNRIICSRPEIPLYPLPERFKDMRHAGIAVANCREVIQRGNDIRDVRDLER